MLAEAVDGFGLVGREAIGDAVGLLAVQGLGRVGARERAAFAEEVFAGEGGEGEVAVVEGERDGDRGGLQRGADAVLGEVKVCARAGLRGRKEPRLRELWVAAVGARDDVDDGVRADGDAHGFGAYGGVEASCGLGDVDGRRSWELLAGHLRDGACGCGAG